MQVFILMLLAGVAAARGSVESLGSYLHHSCGEGNISTPYKDYALNLNRLIFKQFYNESAKLFSNGTRGKSPNKVYDLFSCRGDIKPTACESCVFQAAQEVLIRRCFKRKSAMIWFEGCFLRYADTSLVSKLDVKHEHHIWDSHKVPKPKWGAFNLAVSNMLRNLTAHATAAGNNHSFATGEVAVKGSPLKAYGLVQCTPSISKSDCKKCLEKPVTSMLKSIQGRQGGRYLNPNCNLRYDVHPFASHSKPGKPGGPPRGKPGKPGGPPRGKPGKPGGPPRDDELGRA
uniref:Gnk2-homologous domain-containing protein n=1 Tax=Kalanchoe fedtschenkoi TaxID=63787 RepID=A0A7N1A1G6_KALFE